jgi:uncharacterized membrane protein
VTAGSWVEQRLLHPIPGYQAIKSLLNALAGNGQVESFRPMLLRSGEDEEEIVFLIEELGDDRAAVLIPFAPTPMAGNVRFVPKARLLAIGCRVGSGLRGSLPMGGRLEQTPGFLIRAIARTRC